MNAVLKAIEERRSIRAYTDRQLTNEEIETILLAAKQAPSARNSQPWHFTVCQDQALIHALEDETRRIRCEGVPEGQRKNFDDPNYRVFFNAPTVIFISTPIEAPTKFSQIDCGIAVENMALAAHSMGLGSVIIGMIRTSFEGEKRAEFEKALSFPEGYEFAIAIALGTPAAGKAPHLVREDLVSYVL